MASRFDVERVAAKLTALGFSPVSTSNGLELKVDSGTTSLSIERTDGAPSAHGISEVVRLTHELPSLANQLKPIPLAVWNMYAGLSSAIATKGASPPLLSARVTVFEGEDYAAEVMYPDLIAAAMSMMPSTASFLLPGSPSAAEFISGEPAPGPSWFGFGDEASGPSPVKAGEFTMVRNWSYRQGFQSNARLDSVSSDMPWSSDGPPVGEGRALQFELKTDTPHPLFGGGLFAILRLPVSFTLETVFDVIDDLNRWEREDSSLPPALGSWCLDGVTKSPLFVCFLPNRFAFLDAPRILAPWMVARGLAVRSRLSATDQSGR